MDAFFQDATDLPAEKFRGEAGGLGINGDEPTGVRLIAFRSFESGVGEEESIFVGRDFSGDSDFYAGLYHLRDEFLIEPNTPDGAGFVGDGRFSEEHLFPKGTTGFEGRDGTTNRRPFIGDEIGYRASD